jgi:hypothetical protein
MAIGISRRAAATKSDIFGNSAEEAPHSIATKDDSFIVQTDLPGKIKDANWLH